MKPHEVMLVLGSQAAEVQEGLRPGVTLSLRAHQVLWLVLRPPATVLGISGTEGEDRGSLCPLLSVVMLMGTKVPSSQPCVHGGPPP